jgi:hypothetical protein
MPVRIIPKNYRNLTGLVANTKAQRMTAFESTLEKDFLLLLDFDPAVGTYEESSRWPSSIGMSRANVTPTNSHPIAQTEATTVRSHDLLEFRTIS